MGRRGYPSEFRRKVPDLVEAGRTVTDVARDLDISSQTIHSWRRQDHIDRGLEPGLTSSEKAELLAARQRIAELETELQATRRAIEPVREVVPPKGGSKPSRSRSPAASFGCRSRATTPGATGPPPRARSGTPG
ncbi:transposase [Streptosporangium sp. LJ11]|uniref:transposase n=1 Tax=Streptosporangium sp. LJ11 TaxID=3436927 RepID=UPI003F7A84A0